MKTRLLFTVLMVIIFLSARSQISTTTVADDYKVINIGTNTYGDYTRSLILLHEIYNGTLIDHNYAIGTITAMRGNSSAGNLLNVVNVTTSSAYSGISGTINSNDNNVSWALKTCMYNGKRYLAVDIPYNPAYHNWGYYFSGWTTSTGENMKCVPYLVNGVPVNTTLISNIQDFSSDMTETHNAAAVSITGNVGIGTATPAAKLDVVGGSVQVTNTNPTYALIDNSNSNYSWSVQNTAGAYRFFDNTVNAERMRINSDGNVGIGTTSPTRKFYVAVGTGLPLQRKRVPEANGSSAITLELVAETIHSVFIPVLLVPLIALHLFYK